MSFLSSLTRPSAPRRSTIDCRRCGERITLADQIRKVDDGFAHQGCAETTPTLPTQRRP